MENNNTTKSPSNWKRPDEVMKIHRLKQKKRALLTEANTNVRLGVVNCSPSSDIQENVECPVAKRRNPFLRRSNESDADKSLTDESGLEMDVSCDTTLFQFIQRSQSSKVTSEVPKSFANILSHLNDNANLPYSEPLQTPKIRHKDGLEIPIDFSIKSKLRLISTSTFPWSDTLKTGEQASSITGFVRCLDLGNTKQKDTLCSLDTSGNARFHQCCSYWQHPNLPWLDLFPRDSNRTRGGLISAQLEMAGIMRDEWAVAFKSLFGLVRTRQCPYFYVIANRWSCLFIATGIAGVKETWALINPTSRGFRRMLDEEGVQYEMPLKKKRKSNEFFSDSASSQGTLNKVVTSADGDSSDPDSFDDEDWLESMGLDIKEIKKMTDSQKAIKRINEGRIDGSEESLLVIKDANVQAFFNVLVNCKSSVASTGPFAGVPPTLIAPNAFKLATLKSCKVKDKRISMNGSNFYSIQIEGPILPQALRQICMLLERYENRSSVSATTVKQTIGFTEAFKKIDDNNDENKSSSTVFLKENLSDCGLSENLISVFCEDDPKKFDVIEKIEPKN